MRSRKIDFKEFSDWFLPPKIKKIFLNWKNRKIWNLRKYWLYQPIRLEVKDFPFFTDHKKEAYWLSLNKEVRPGILIGKNCTLNIPLENSNFRWIQFGLGTEKNCQVRNVDVFIDQQKVGTLSNVTGQSWHDIRFDLKNKRGEIELKINASGKGPLFFSYPMIDQGEVRVNNQIQNVICLILDGVTPEYLKKDIAPHIHQFFSDGIFCENTYAQSDWTLPAFSSMLTSLYPSKHGVYNPDEYDSAIPNSVPVLTEILCSHGYRTFGYSGHLRFSPAYGHVRGFERFIFSPMAYGDYYTREINDAIQHLEAHKDNDNFLFLHFFDTHYPYRPLGYLKNILMGPERDFSIYDGAFDEQESNTLLEYLSLDCITKIREVDLALRAFFSYISEQPWFKDSIIILTADHGIPHRRKGKRRLFSDRVNIPLCVKGPNIMPGKNNAFIEGSVDLMPSILFMAGIPSPKNVDGKIWPFLGKDQRTQVFTESLFRTVYEASVKDNNFSYYVKCPFDQKTRKIYFEHEREITIFERLNKEEIERAPQDNSDQTFASKFKPYLTELTECHEETCQREPLLMGDK